MGLARPWRAVIVLALCLAVVPACFGWGADAHKIIAQIAWHDMTSHARAAVETLLKADPDCKDLGEASIWADRVRNDAVVVWSPDHELVNVGSAFTVTDPDVGDTPTVTGLRVLSDESEVPDTGDGTGRHAPDFKTQLACGDEGLSVRSERRGPEDGRFYIFVITADDGHGGVTMEVCIAAVCPHDQDDESLADVMAQAEAVADDVQTAIDTLGVENLVPSDLGLYEHGLSEELGLKQ